MHIRSYGDEPQTIEKMERFIEENGYINNISDTHRHHEIYLSDPRKCKSEKQKTALRIPVRKRE